MKLQRPGAIAQLAVETSSSGAGPSGSSGGGKHSVSGKPSGSGKRSAASLRQQAAAAAALQRRSGVAVAKAAKRNLHNLSLLEQVADVSLDGGLYFPLLIARARWGRAAVGTSILAEWKAQPRQEAFGSGTVLHEWRQGSSASDLGKAMLAQWR